MQNTKRVYGLDILRAVAILDILIAHSFHRAGYAGIIGIFDGVNLFFVLSGFLIGRILINLLQKDFTIKSLLVFWCRRWLRTLPAYFFILSVVCVYYRLAHGENYNTFIKYYLFLKSFFYSTNVNIYPESWSLCIEEWFYLSVPVILILLKKFTSLKTKRLLLLVIFGTIFLDTALRLYQSSGYANFKDWNMEARQGTVFRIDSIMYGVFGAYLTYFDLWVHKKLLFGIGIMLWIVSIISFQMPFNNFFNYGFLTLQSVGTLLLIPVLNDLKTGRGILFDFVTFTSIISYSMYLLNLTPFMLISKDIKSAPLLFIGDIVFTYAGGYITYLCIEKPFMQLREKRNIKKRLLLIWR